MEARARKRRAAKLSSLQEDGSLTTEDIQQLKKGQGGRRKYCMCARDTADRLCCCTACSRAVGVCCGLLCSPCKALGGVVTRATQPSSSGPVIALRVQESKSATPSEQPAPASAPLASRSRGTGRSLDSDTAPVLWRRCTVPQKPSMELLQQALISKFRPGAPPGVVKIGSIVQMPDSVLLESDADCAHLKNGDALVVRFASTNTAQSNKNNKDE